MLGRAKQSEDRRRRRAMALYEGRVQGVGFRFTVHQLATAHKVTGLVRNLHDGSVQLILEGEEEEIRALFGEILTSRLGRYIAGTTATWSDATDEFNTFSIGY